MKKPGDEIWVRYNGNVVLARILTTPMEKSDVITVILASNMAVQIPKSDVAEEKDEGQSKT